MGQHRPEDVGLLPDGDPVPESLEDLPAAVSEQDFTLREALPGEVLVSGWFPVFAQPSRFTSFSIASPTGEGLTRPRSLSRERRLAIAGGLRIV